jgi:ABC-type transport system involved in multi-copper enzyme maturation permease subunit
MNRHSFVCLARAEVRKVVRQRSNWALLPAALAVGALAGETTMGDQAAGLGLFQSVTDAWRLAAASAVGVVMLAISARLVAMEYQHGTIRVVLGRGVGRLRLLAAQLAALAAVALVLLFAVALVLVAAVALVATVFAGVRLHQQPVAIVWNDLWSDALTVALSTVACGLLGVAAAALGRSLTFAAAVAIGFFPVDNGLSYILQPLAQATQERVWLDLSTYLLGPTLNHLPSVLMGRTAVELSPPLLPVDATHSLLVIVGYLAVFAAAAIVLTGRRDTTE